MRPPGRRSPACARPAITPRPIGRWASACSTASPSPRRTPGRRGWRAWRSWTSTSTTATARKRPSTTIRRCCSCRATSIRTIRAPARPPRSGAAPGPVSPSTCRSRPGPATPISTRSTGGSRVPVLDAFAPELVLVSAGFDAHEDDPLAALRMTAPGFANLTRLLLGVAARHAGGRIVLVTEGGYDLDGLATSLHATLEACAEGAAGGRCRRSSGDRTRGRPRRRRRRGRARRALAALSGGSPRPARISGYPRRRRRLSRYLCVRLPSARPRHQVAGPLARRPGLRSGRGSVQAEVLLPGDVRLSVGARARRPRPQLHHRRRRRPAEAAPGLQRAAPVRLGRLRAAGRERRDQERHPSRDLDPRQHRAT